MQKFLPAVQYFGAINSLTQTLLKLTSPGVPDIYQGQELWDFSLVDPDNRRPVNFDLRERALEQLTGRLRQSGDLPELCQQLLHNYHDGRIKLWVTMRGVELTARTSGTIPSRQVYSVTGEPWQRGARRGVRAGAPGRSRDCSGSATELHADEGKGGTAGGCGLE